MNMLLNTKCVLAGYTPGNGEPRQIPINQSTTFKYDTSEEIGALFDLQKSGNVLFLFFPALTDITPAGGA